MSTLQRRLAGIVTCILLGSCSTKAAADGVISGKVTDTDGLPVEHLSVLVYEHNQVVRATFTQLDGTYTVDRLNQSSKYDVAVASISTELARVHDVTATAKNISMKVQLRKLRGKVLTPAGEPAANVAVLADSIDWALQRTARTDKNGAFEIGQLPPTILEVSASADGLRNKTIRVDTTAANANATIKFESSGELEVLVLEKTTKQPLPLVEVSLAEEIAGTPRYRSMGVTDTSGKVIDKNVLPGHVMLMPASPLHQEAATRVRLLPNQQLHVTLYADRSSKLVGDLSAHLRHETTPIEKVTVMAEPISLRPMGDVGAYSGSYSDGRIVIAVPPGTYRVHVIIQFGKKPEKTGTLVSPPPSHLLRSEPVTVSRGQEAKLQFAETRN
jgi:5-hydroxyisourate hydrolase-like protein (transthyretin family)